MRSWLLLSAGFGLLDFAKCGVLKLNLEQVSMSEQLEYMDFGAQASSLARKYHDVEANTVLRGSHKDEKKCQDGSIHLEGDIDTVPVLNFMNSECKLYHYFR